MKKTLIIVGIISFLISGILGFVWQTNSAETLPVSKIVPLSKELEKKSETGEITFSEYQQIISKYNQKLDEIRKNCSLDKRCENGQVIFGTLKDKKDIVKVMNKFLRESNNLYSK